MTLQVCPRDTRLLAAKMLSCWRSGDACLLFKELDEMISLPEATADGVESERLEVLKSMARRMKIDADLFAPPHVNPRVGTWIDLLDHFSRSAK